MLTGSGLFEQRVAFVYSLSGVRIGMSNVLMPSVVLPLFAAFRAIDQSVVQAAETLGAGPFALCRRLFLPLTAPGALAGATIVFMSAIGYYLTPALMGGPAQTMVAQLIGLNINTQLDWGLDAALSVVVLAETVFVLAMIVPAIILAVALYYLLARWGMVSSRFALGLGHTVLATPFVVVTVGAALRRFDRSLELAALGLGASWLTMTRRVLLPAIAPGVIASAVFAFVTSFDDVVLALFLTNVRSRTLPKLMYEGVAHEIDPTITAVAVLLVLFTALILAVDLVLERRRR